MPTRSHLSTEKSRIVLIGLFGIAVGYVIGSVWMGLAISYFGYSCWLIYQASQVDAWLQKGAKRNTAPDTDGVIGNIEKLIFRSKQSNRNRKARMKKILGWYNRSAAALPDATVVTNENFEIIWANEAELEIEFKSPANQNVTLAVRRVTYAENMYLFSARDVSQRVQLRETRAAFVANASHELKTPLTVVNGYLELLREDESLPPAVQQKLAIAEEHAIRMKDIVTDLLTLSKLESQQLEQTKLTPVAVAEIITNIIDDLQGNKIGHKHEFEINVDHNIFLHGSESEINAYYRTLLPCGQRTFTQIGWHRFGAFDR